MGLDCLMCGRDCRVEDDDESGGEDEVEVEGCLEDNADQVRFVLALSSEHGTS